MEKYKGYHIVGFDGDCFDLPPSGDILEKGYRGYPLADDRETHYLKMYLVKCVDLLSNVILDFTQSPINDEIGLAVQMFLNLPKNTIAVFDRLYLSARLIDAHMNCGLCFIARCKSGTTFKEIVDFYNSECLRSFFIYGNGENQTRITLIKIKNPKTGEIIALATNIDVNNWTNEEIANLYTLRWDCETNNRDLTSTLKVEQWHSTFFNGIMQEVYVQLVMMNISKITIFQEGGYKINLEDNQTSKANFKYIFFTMLRLLPEIFFKKIDSVLEIIRSEINKTIEKRKRLFRNYNREVKLNKKSYANASVVKRRLLK